MNLQEEAKSETTSVERLTELALQSEELAEIVASNVTAPPELLKKLASHDSEAVKKAVVSNPNISKEILFELGKDYPQQLLKNSILDILFLENPNFAEDIPWQTLFRLLRQPIIPKYLLKSIAHHSESVIAEEAKLHVNYAGEMTQGWHETAAAAIEKIYFFDEEIDYKGYIFNLYRDDFLCDFKDLLSPRLLGINNFLIHSEEKINNPNTLIKLAADSNVDIKDYVAENPNTPLYILEQLAFDKNADVRASTGYNSSTPAYILEKLAIDKDIEVRQSVAENPNTPIHILEQLANDKDADVRQLVAENPNTPIHILEQLANDKDADVRQLVAQNSNVTVSILEKLANDKDADVRREVAKNINTPTPILEKLIKHKSTVDCVATNPKTPVHILEQLAVDRDINIVSHVAFHPNTPVNISENLFKQLATNEDSFCRRRVARNPKTPIAILKQLAKDKDIYVRQDALKNSTIPVDIIKSIYLDEQNCDLPIVLEALATNFNTPKDILEKLANSNDFNLRRSVAKNENILLSTLKKLASDEHHWVRNAVIYNNNTSMDILEKLAKDEHPANRYNVASYGNCSFEIKERIFKSLGKIQDSFFVRFVVFMSDYAASEDLATNYNSKYWLERYGVAQNNKTPEETLKLLAKDCNRIVRATAKESLSNRQISFLN